MWQQRQRNRQGVEVAAAPAAAAVNSIDGRKAVDEAEAEKASEETSAMETHP